MSIQTTPFLHLPQWTAEEQPSFLGEINPAWASIDEGYGDIKTSAGTAITTANAAVNTANEAKSQSQANAGAITQLQQNLQLLRTELESASTLKNASVEAEITPEYAEMFSGITCNVVYNNYCCLINIGLGVKSNLNWAKPAGKNTVATVNLPFAYSTLSVNTDISTIGSTLKFGPITTTNGIFCTIQNGNVNLSITDAFTPVITTTPPAIDIRASFPVFAGVANRGTMPDNCLFMLAD